MQADKKLNILIWGFPSWQGDYMKSTVELAKELSVKHRVMYIDYAYTIKDVASAAPNSTIPVDRILNNEPCLKSFRLDNGANISVLSLPPILPFNWTNSRLIYNLIEKLNYYIICERIKTNLRHSNFKPDVVINAFNPFFGKAIKRLFPAVPVVYYCYDNISASVWAAKHGGRLEQEFAPHVNAAVFSSDALKENKRWGVPAYVVKNGVDLRIFGQVTATNAPQNDKKIIGYVGSVDERLDYELLHQVITANPQYEFQFIGRVISSGSEQLKSLDNVKFFGAVPPERLPGMMQHFNAGIIPFVKNEFTRNIYPMKVNEYLALGIPVVCTGFTVLNDLHGFIEIADDATAFTGKLDEVINNNNDFQRYERRVKAQSNSWQQKSTEFENILLKYVA